LEAKVIDLEPRKRKRVKASPNSKFAGIGAIRRAQIKAGDREINKEDSDKTDKLSFTLSYITIN
jgi:4-hydroxybenzoate polyprenyltransferase